MSTNQALRRGKWTPEEERFVERVIQDFISGKLAAAPGTTLRNYLSEKLHCDPMRITKKFTGGASIGKRVYQPCERASQAALERARRECLELEAAFRSKLDTQAHEATSRFSAGGGAARRSAPSSQASSSSSANREAVLTTEASRRVDDWLRSARNALRRAETTAAFDAMIAAGEKLRASLAPGDAESDDEGSAATSDDDSADGAPRSPAPSAAAMRCARQRPPPPSTCSSASSAASSAYERGRPRRDVASDEEATSLLVDFRQSARRRRDDSDSEEKPAKAQRGRGRWPPDRQSRVPATRPGDFDPAVKNEPAAGASHQLCQ